MGNLKIVVLEVVLVLAACGCCEMGSHKERSVKTGLILDMSVRSIACDTDEETIHRGACVSLFSCEWNDQANPRNELAHHGLRVCLLSKSHSLQGVGLGVLGLGANEVDGVLIGGIVGGREARGVMIGLVTGFPIVGRPTVSDGGGMELGVINLGSGYWIQVGGINSAIQSLLQVGAYNITRAKVIWGGQIGLINVQINEEATTRLQIGVLNAQLTDVETSNTWGQQWQFGLLNRLASGWWLPLSNFGF